jgi:hypothetical protein
MNLFKINISILIVVLSLTSSYSQVVTKRQQQEFSITEGQVVDISSKYTNLEFELTNDEVLTLEAIMEIEGLTEKELESHFNNWNFKANKNGNRLEINSVLQTDANYRQSGYYKGYFVDTEELTSLMPEKNDAQKKAASSNTLQKQGEFDYDAYIEQGNAYLKQWEKENNEKIGKRWYDKSREERIKMRQAKKESLSNLDTKRSVKNKNILPSTNVRDLSKRAVINKTLKIKIPRKAKLNIKAKHGMVVFVGDIKNLKAELSYVLLKANSLSGSETSIKGSYSNFEIEYWKDGNLDILFSDYTLIKEVQNIALKSTDSTVSIDNVTRSIDAKGHFKMLSIDASAEIKYVNVDIEDSKEVWLKLPKTQYNLKYEGVNSKLIHPEKFSLKSNKNKSGKQTIESNLLKNNERIVHIKSLSSIMQIYDIPWENLTIKTL